ncbi:glycerol kinase GlpK [Legionella jordanis]|uniref:Glycerol kinase n=1 Tax=Legionella jordanis TaxID=456 RepID=A0A0W0V7P2_9GAMM|nr:glycerol kinase GlpK [Legionella jordanis]KTD16151.1 glycerol kinase [Legionella jordanis]RMX04623.1 glycerol kinase [Legionella jordanis]VEH12389.1 glycerol kinase [Legionella jordanis]HAT8713902.1 glycerol kinase GlpK [Legionella jordanis]
MNYLLAIDQGTSSTRAIVYESSGKLIHSSQYALKQSYPKAGWVEHDPEEIWTKTLKAILDVAEQVGAEKIAACGITNQRETTVIWDKQSGKCLAPAIVWQDRRTEGFCQSLVEFNDLLQAKTGLLADPYFSGSKLHWLFDNLPEARELASKNQLAFGTIDSFLIWRLTKGHSHLTDVSNASRTLLFNIHSLQWDEELLDLFKVPLACLPQVCNSDAQFGAIDKSYLGKPIPITGVAGDQQAALIGQGCFQEGMIKATFGTGGFLLLNLGSNPAKSNYGLLTTIAYGIKDEIAYGMEGSLYHAGTTIKWLCEEMKLIATPDESESLAQSLSSNEGVYLLPSFTGLGAPHWSSAAGAAIVGLSRTTNRAHFARAALESVCYLTRDVLTAMRKDSGLVFSKLRVDGGMAVNNWFLQFLASQCDLIVQRPKEVESTAQGAAMLAALGAGLINSLDELQKNWRLDKEFYPGQDREAVEANYHGWQKALSILA